MNADRTGTVTFSRDTEDGKLLSAGTLAAVWDDNMQEVRFLLTSIVAPDGTTKVPVTMKGEGRKLFLGGSSQQ